MNPKQYMTIMTKILLNDLYLCVLCIFFGYFDIGGMLFEAINLIIDMAKINRIRLTHVNENIGLHKLRVRENGV